MNTTGFKCSLCRTINADKHILEKIENLPLNKEVKINCSRCHLPQLFYKTSTYNPNEQSKEILIAN